MTEGSKHEQESTADAGFALVGAVVMVFLVTLALSIAAPRIAMQIKRDRELESQRRAQQYERAIRVYYLKFKHYPGSVEQLEKSNNQRFLRQKYVDPLTGKDDWRLIHVGENKTKVTVFFGEEIPGLQTGLGSAAGLASPTGGQTTGGAAPGTSGSAFNNGGVGGGAPGGPGGPGGAAQPGTPGTGFGAAGNSGTGSGFGSGTAGSGISSQNATDATGSGGPIMGVGSSKSGEAMLVVNEQTNYQDWEFLYDPRIEQYYAKASLLGGISSGSGGSTPGFGTPIGGTPVGGPGSPATPAGGAGAPGTPANGTTPPQ